MAVDDGGRQAGQEEEEEFAVRPYTMTGGRTRTAASIGLPIEALVEGLSEAKATHTPEQKKILELTANQYLSVMELAAHMKVPLGVVRILASDLHESKDVRIHGLTPSMSTPGTSQDNTAATLSVLESVLNGIASL